MRGLAATVVEPASPGPMRRPGAGRPARLGPRWNGIATPFSARLRGSWVGGEVMCSHDRVTVGLSARPDPEGVAALRPVVAQPGDRLGMVDTPRGILHFKTECGFPGPGTVRATRGLAATGCFRSMRVIETAQGEDAAASAIAVNGRVCRNAGSPGTAARPGDAGFGVADLPTGQAALVDGGRCCMSLRYSLGNSR